MEERKELVNRPVLPHNDTPPSARSDAPADAAVDSVLANHTAQPLRLRYAKPCNGVCTGGCGGLECLDEWPVLSETQAQRKRKGSTWRVEYRTIVKTPQAP